MTISGPRLTIVAIRQHYLPRRFLMTPAQCDISRKLRIFNCAKQIGNVSVACRHFGISREIYYRWKRAYEKDGEQALVNSKPCPENPKLRTKPEVEEKNHPSTSDIPLRPAADCLVPRALPRHHPHALGVCGRRRERRLNNLAATYTKSKIGYGMFLIFELSINSRSVGMIANEPG
jgi:transposase-like protein